jgi:hypothetical protein
MCHNPKLPRFLQTFHIKRNFEELTLFFCLNFLNHNPHFTFHCLPKKEEGDDDDDDEENLCNKEATFKGKDFIEDSGGHHKLEGPIPKLDSAYHKKSKSHL